jgi:hypothetical protein
VEQALTIPFAGTFSLNFSSVHGLYIYVFE